MDEVMAPGEYARRLRTAGAEMLNLREALVAGEPWPLSASYGTEPEADWGPREVLAHVNEMLGYWVVQLGIVRAGDEAAPAAFGRQATDAERLRRIAEDRHLTTGVLLDGIEPGVAHAAAFIDDLTPADLDRRGLHPTRGEVTIGRGLEVFLVGHLEDHVTQLRDILARGSAA